MKITFLGGASGIGASCALLESASLRLVVDAGIRQGRGEALPDLGLLQQRLGNAVPDAIVLTHAHLDHTGALPALHAAFRQVPVICTSATADLLRILLLDAVKIMEQEREGEIPLYSEAQVHSALAAIRRIPFDRPYPLGRGNLRLLPAGHVLGAAMLLVEDRDGSVLFSGDISVGSQSTIAGMPRPRCSPDTLVVEATYGDRLHSARQAEERRLVERVSSVVEGGGHVLIPAFALGRAQELLVILARAMAQGSVPPCPVHADGMVRAVCDVYREHPDLLLPHLRHRALSGEDPFFPKKLPFARVRDAAGRQAVMEGPPCVVVASSGMLSGGASPLYLRAWAGDPRNLVAITGYQDEESPGRALLALADGDTRLLSQPGGALELACGVERYHLSAHADAGEIAGLVQALSPGTVFLVHGEGEARQALAERIATQCRARVLLPDEGPCLEARGGGRAESRRWQGPGLGAGRPLDAPGLATLAEYLLRGGPGRVFSPEELARTWWGESMEATQIEQVECLLQAGSPSFEPDRMLPYRFRPLPAQQRGPVSLSRLQELSLRLLPPSTGFVRLSVQAPEGVATLVFQLPDALGPEITTRVQALRAQSGWRLDLHPHPQQTALRDALTALLPEGVAIEGSPSYHPDLKQTRARLATSVEPSLNQQELCARYRAATGWELSIELGLAQSRPSAGIPSSAPMDPQQARVLVGHLFSASPEHLRPLRVTWPGAICRLHFMHPGIARHHGERMEELALLMGRAVEIHPQALHQELLPWIRARIPPDWALSSAPSWVLQRAVVRVNVAFLPADDEVEAFRAAMEAEIGCDVVVEQG